VDKNGKKTAQNGWKNEKNQLREVGDGEKIKGKTSGARRASEGRGSGKGKKKGSTRGEEKSFRGGRPKVTVHQKE